MQKIIDWIKANQIIALLIGVVVFLNIKNRFKRTNTYKKLTENAKYKAAVNIAKKLNKRSRPYMRFMGRQITGNY
jgi:hypothetical protein